MGDIHVKLVQRFVLALEIVGSVVGRQIRNSENAAVFSIEKQFLMENLKFLGLFSAVYLTPLNKLLVALLEK